MTATATRTPCSHPKAGRASATKTKPSSTASASLSPPIERTQTMTRKTLRAVRITAETFEHLTIDDTNQVHQIQHEIGCRYFEVVNLEDNIDVFIDDEGAINGTPLNLWLTILAPPLGPPAVLFGNALILGINPDTGESISLTDAQLERLTQAVTAKPS